MVHIIKIQFVAILLPVVFFFFNDTATTEIYTLSLHDALPICQDVIDLQPKAVVILAGTNDIAGNTGPMRLEDIEANFSSLAELARAHDIEVIYASILPVHNYTPRSQDLFAQRSPAKILELNRWLKGYCGSSSSVGRANGCVYLDYFSALVDDKGLLKKELAEDGLHPNAAGYKIMAPLAEAAIEKTLGNQKP